MKGPAKGRDGGDSRKGNSFTRGGKKKAEGFRAKGRILWPIVHIYVMERHSPGPQGPAGCQRGKKSEGVGGGLKILKRDGEGKESHPNGENREGKGLRGSSPLHRSLPPKKESETSEPRVKRKDN